MAAQGNAAVEDVVREVMVVIGSKGVRLALDRSGFGALGPAELELAHEFVRGDAPNPARLDELAAASGTEIDRFRSLLQVLDQQVLSSRGLPASSAVVSIGAGSADLAADTLLVTPTPLVVLLRAEGFEVLDHQGGTLTTLSARELAAIAGLGRPGTPASLLDRWPTAEAPSLDEVIELLARFERIGLVHRVDDSFTERDATSRTERELRDALANLQLVADAVEQAEAEHLVQATTDLVPLIGVHPNGPCPAAGIGMVLAYAQVHDGGRLTEHFDFFPRWVMNKNRLARFTERPGIFLFSNYLWSVGTNLDISAEVKRRSPGSIVIHGGPDTPKYERDVERFFADNPQVDITVRGEGELTFAAILEVLAGVELGDALPDLSGLRDVPGLCFRDGAEVVQTPDRDRVTDIDIIPSPYLAGFFDPYAAADESTAIIETNRGCPYSCTFCDWGSATASRIRKFDLQRVFDELEWCAKNGVARVWVADANFGIFERDVDIARKVAELKAEYGYPKVFGTNYAKNTVKHLQPIVQVLADAGILTEGILSLQSMDEATLKTIKRSNIKVEKYDALAKEFRAAGLPLYVDLMVGLPGSTLQSFRNDLQQCVDREVSARIFSTTMLTNSPMNEPSYREQHKIETKLIGGLGQQLLISTETFSREDHDAMLKLREIYIMCENHGILRQVSRWVHQEAGMGEIDLYEAMWRAAIGDRDRWPAMAFVFEAGPSLMVPPVSWRLFIDEVGRFLVEVLGLPADSALDTVLEVQHALLPARNRTFPDARELLHDFAAWHHAALAAKEDGGDRTTWPERSPRLRDFGPAQFAVDDPNRVCELNMGYHTEGDIYSDWELRSPVARSMPATHLAT